MRSDGARANLFSSKFDGALTIIGGALVILALWFGLKWIFVDADWTVIKVLGGRLAIGQYNTDAACPGNDCVWRPQAALLLVTVLLGMGWGMAGGGLAKRLALAIAIIAAAFALLPYSLETMGWNVRLMLVANLPAVGIGWLISSYTPLRTPGWMMISGVIVFVLVILLLRGIEGVPGLKPVSEIYWGGMMLNVLLAVEGIAMSPAHRHRPGAGAAKQFAGGEGAVRGIHRGVPGHAADNAAVHVPGAGAAGLSRELPVEPPDARGDCDNPVQLGLHGGKTSEGACRRFTPGQAEGARALGLAGWQTTLFISLPQAIRNVIPAIVGQFIALFKDTTLVYIIGMLDIVGIGRAFIQSNPEYLPEAKELFVFLAVVFLDFLLHHVLYEQAD